MWLDDLSRDRLRSGNLQELIDTKSVVGVTTNPSIFQKALSEGHTYDAQIAELAARGADVDATIRTVTTDDVRSACDVLVPQWEDSDGVDGRVSIEVDPRLAHETEKTIQQAIELWKIVDRPNLFIKIPATKAGLPAISAVLAEGISVNVTLIFSVQRYREVMDAYLTGMEKARQAGHSLSKIHSVASFFVSRVDTEIDKRLDRIGSRQALELRGQAGVANARLAYAAYREVFEDSDRYRSLKVDGARVQRPLWASTGVKNPDYSDTLYVTELVAPHTVNTMPEKTIDAVADPWRDPRRHGHRNCIRCPGGVRPAGGDRHRPHRRVCRPRGGRRAEVRGLLERATPGNPGASRHRCPMKPAHAAASWRNPLRDKRDKRLPRIAGPCGHGDFRRHRRPGPQEGDAGRLRFGQPRPAAAHILAGGGLPAETGAPRISVKWCTTPSKSTAEHRFGNRTGTGWPRDSVLCQALSTTTTRSPNSPRRWRSSTPSAAPAATTPSTWRSRPNPSRWCVSSCTSPAWPARKATGGAES
ncbi:transaldolase [Mycobacterium tuberculosis RGTB423]|nr:transaldolase [Mycobacterium tuberculosis RGTB423]